MCSFCCAARFADFVSPSSGHSFISPPGPDSVSSSLSSSSGSGSCTPRVWSASSSSFEALAEATADEPTRPRTLLVSSASNAHNKSESNLLFSAHGSYSSPFRFVERLFKQTADRIWANYVEKHVSFVRPHSWTVLGMTAAVTVGLHVLLSPKARNWALRQAGWLTELGLWMGATISIASFVSTRGYAVPFGSTPRPDQPSSDTSCTYRKRKLFLSFLLVSGWIYYLNRRHSRNSGVIELVRSLWPASLF